MAFNLLDLLGQNGLSGLFGSPAPQGYVPTGPAAQMPQFNGPLPDQDMQPQQPQPMPGSLAPIPQVMASPLGSPAPTQQQMPAPQPMQQPQAAPQPQLPPQMAPSPQQPSSSLLGGLGSGLSGLLDGFHGLTHSGTGRALGDFLTGMATGATPQQSLGNGAQLLSAGRSLRQEQDLQKAKINQTAQYLTGRGLSPGDAALLASNPTALQGYLKETLAPKDNSTNDIKNYRFAVQNGFKGSFTDFQNTGANGTKYGLQPIYGTDANGNQVLGTLGNDGTFKAIDTGGVKIQSGVEKIDLGTHYQLRDKRTGQVIGVEPKDIVGAEQQKALGKVQGQAQATLPTDISNADQTVAQIDQLLKNPGLDDIVGPLDQYRGSVTLGENGRDALARYNQLKGKAFLQAYGILRGGGPITEVEGAKAQDAMARMDRSQSEGTFRQALGDFRDAVNTGVQKMREKAGVASGAPGTVAVPAAPAAPSAAPAPGTVMQGYRFRGGNPADRNSWEPVQ